MIILDRKINQRISILLSDLIVANNETPIFLQDQKHFDIIFNTLKKAQNNLTKNNFSKAKTKLSKVINIYNHLSKHGISFGDECSIDIGVLKSYLKDWSILL